MSNTKLILIKLYAKRKQLSSNMVWLSKFRCECGNICYFQMCLVKRGQHKDCGCVRRLQGILNAAGLSRILGNYIGAANKRNIIWNLSKEEATTLFLSDCFYCGAIPTARKTHPSRINSRIGYFNGIDRKDNSKGYDISNCVACCKFCNIAKNTLSVNDFLENIRRVYLHQIKQEMEEIAA